MTCKSIRLTRQVAYIIIIGIERNCEFLIINKDRLLVVFHIVFIVFLKVILCLTTSIDFETSFVLFCVVNVNLDFFLNAVGPTGELSC